MAEQCLALDLVSTIRHDGNGGVADDLTTVDGTAQWLQEPLRALALSQGGLVVDEDLRHEIVALRRAIRALFARAVSPAPPSPADANRLMPVEEALTHVNAAAARHGVAPQLVWLPGEAPTTRLHSSDADVRGRLLAGLARSAIDLLAGPRREQLRACAAPRCVRYFLKSHGRQEWCKASCGNRARAARHYDRTRTAQATPPS